MFYNRGEVLSDQFDRFKLILFCEEFILPDWSPPDDPARPGRLWPSDDDDDEIGGDQRRKDVFEYLVNGRQLLHALGRLKHRLG